MNMIVEVRKKLKEIYVQAGLYIEPILKFVLAFVIFKGINNQIHFVQFLDNIYILLIAALLCSIMPLNLTVILGLLLVLGQCYGAGLEVAAFAGVLILLMVTLYVRFASKEAIVLLLTPIACAWNIPCAIPLGYGLAGSPASAVSAAFGIIVYYFIGLVNKGLPAVPEGEEAGFEQILENIKFLTEGMLKNQEMYVFMIACVLSLVLVNVIRKLSVDYARQIAIGVGAITYIASVFMGSNLFAAEISIGKVMGNVILSVVLVEIIELFVFCADYKKTEYLQFEDDEYYYYVKAIPKIENGKSDIWPDLQQEIGLVPEDTGAPVQKPDEEILDQLDLESRLEESLDNLQK